MPRNPRKPPEGWWDVLNPHWTRTGVLVAFWFGVVAVILGGLGLAIALGVFRSAPSNTPEANTSVPGAVRTEPGAAATEPADATKPAAATVFRRSVRGVTVKGEAGRSTLAAKYPGLLTELETLLKPTFPNLKETYASIEDASSSGPTGENFASASAEAQRQGIVPSYLYTVVELDPNSQITVVGLYLEDSGNLFVNIQASTLVGAVAGPVQSRCDGVAPG